jgi:FkbM family methyltransferase
MSLLKKYFGDRYRKYVYAQCGEDIIVDFLRKRLGLKKEFTYLDVGAFHPSRFSNTYYFYRKGFTGVCVEPDPQLCREIAARRRRDKVLNIGIGLSSDPYADFYQMSSRTLNTFSREEAERYVASEGKQIEKVIRIPLVNINEVISAHFAGCQHFVSIDVEGLDFEIVRFIDFQLFRPQIFCVETASYSEDKTGVKLPEVTDYLRDKGYMVYADTYVNTIYVDLSAWSNRDI